MMAIRRRPMCALARAARRVFIGPPRKCHNCPAAAMPDRSRCPECAAFEAAKRAARRADDAGGEGARVL